MTRTLSCRSERWPLARAFATATVTSDWVDLIVVEIAQDGVVGRGEAAGVYYHGEVPAVLLEQIEQVRPAIEAGADRAALARMLPAGGARNAIDCALWELEARAGGRTVADLAGIAATPLVTVTTIGIDTPTAMAAQAADLTAFPILKVKLDADRPVERIAAIRRARTDVRLIVDANTSWSVEQLHLVAPALAPLGVELIEQPCPPADDHRLDRAAFAVPLCADESCQTAADLPRLRRGFSAVCIKLDKTGGLTEALVLASAARAAGMTLMIGNMLGTCLGMAPLSVLGPWCAYVDIDGPLLLAKDRAPGLGADGATVAPLVPRVWG